MKPLRFIHCADLHLGTPFKGISELNPDLGGLLYQSTYLSFDNIVTLAIKENVDCVLIAGDVCDSEDKSLQAQLRFRKGLSRLSDAGIHTLIAYGNHDPLNGWSATLKWPEGVFAFPGDKVECIPLQEHDETIAMVYGISFAKRDIKENLSLRFAPTGEMIYIECDPDFALVKCIANVPRRGIDHELKGKGEICNKLASQSNCKALIDEDPSARQPRYISRLRASGREREITEHELKLLRDSSNNCLIMLCPRLEDWMLRTAREVGIDVRDYGLPHDAKRLHSEININLDKFEKLLEALKSKGSERLKALRSLLERG
jgi:hypothetical protein